VGTKLTKMHFLALSATFLHFQCIESDRTVPRCDTVGKNLGSNVDPTSRRSRPQESKWTENTFRQLHMWELQTPQR